MITTAVLEKAFLICLALGLTSRAIEKGVEATFILLALMIGLTLFLSRTSWSIKNTLKSMKAFFKPWEFKALTLALISFGVSSYIGLHPDYSIRQWYEFLAVLLGGTLLALGMKYVKNKTLDNIPQYFAFSGALFSIVLVLETSGFGSFISEQIRDLEKTPLHAQIRSFSSVVAITVPFAWVYALRHKHLLAWLPAMLMVTGAFACGGRAGWLSLTLGFVAFLLMYDWQNVTNKIKAKALYVLQFILSSFIGIFIYKQMVGNTLFTQRMELTGDETGGSGRTDIWAFTFDNFLQNPLMGIGIKGFRHLDFSTHQLTSTMHPHNALLELLLETGLVGTVFICTFAGLAFIKISQKTLHLRKNKQKNDIHTALVLSFFTFAVCSMTLTSIFHAWWLTFFVVLYTLSFKMRQI